LSRTSSSWTLAALLLGVAAAACSHGHADFMWADDVPKTMLGHVDAYRIGPGDVISIRVWNQDANSVDHARVRDDGKVSVPFLNDVEVGGMDPVDLSRALETKLKPFIQAPVVTVLVHERRAVRISVLGQVARAGSYDLEEDAGVLQALAAAGGLTPFADRSGIYVLRRGAEGDASEPARIRFRYDDLSHGKGKAVLFHLRRGDVVVVE
jgi:polysaccharide export outer membrane protein